MMRARSITVVLSFGLLTYAGACSEAAPTGGATSNGGSGGSGADAAVHPNDGGAAGTGAEPSPAGSDATTPFDGGDGEDASVAPPPDAPDDTAIPAPDSGGGESPWYDAGVVRGCAGNPSPQDPTAGWTEFADPYPPAAAGAEFPSIEYPYNLGPQDNCMTSLPISDMASPCRLRREGSLWTFWIFQNDKSHLPPDAGVVGTDPRVEMHWSTMTAKDPHPRRMWTGDVAVLGDGKGGSPAHNTILQVHAETTGAGPVYLRVEGGKLFQLGGPTYYSPKVGTWFNLKVAYDATTLASIVWVNDCQVGTYNGSSFGGGGRPGGDVFYFKNGSYGCTTGECIVKFANIRFYEK